MTGLAGRDAEFDLLRAALETSPGGALVEAESGAGKTALVTAVYDAEDGPKHWIAADRVLTAHPYGALAAILDTADLATGDPFPGLDRVFDLAGQARPLVVVDNACFLDPPSAQAIGHYASIGAIRLLISSRLLPPLVPQFVELVYSLEFERIRLAPLDESAIRGLIEQRLGGTVCGHVLGVLAVHARGNPGSLLALVDAARRNGHLIEHDGAWVLRGARLALDVVAVELCADGFEVPAGDLRDALVPVALAGRLPVSALLATGRGDATDLLVEAGTLTLDAGSEPTVHVTQPLLAAILRAGISPRARARLFREFAEHVATPDPAAEFAEAWTRWSLESGVESSSEHRHEVARQAHRRGRFALATRLVESLEQNDADFALALAHLYCDGGRPLEAVDIVRRLRDDLTDVGRLLHGALTALRAELLLGESAVVLAEHLIGWSERIRSAGTGPWAAPAAEVITAFATMFGEVPAKPDLGDAAAAGDRAAMPRVLRSALDFITAVAAVGRCDSEQAAALFDRIDVGGWECFRVPGFVWTLRAETLGRLGRYTELDAALSDRWVGDLDAAANGSGALDIIRARRALAAADPRAARAALRSAVAVLEESDPCQLLAAALAASAYAAAVDDDRDAVKEFSRRFERCSSSGARRQWLLARVELDVALSMAEVAPVDAGELLALADVALLSGSRDIECRILLLAAGCGALEDTARMRAFAGATDPAAVLLARLGEALEEGSPQELEDLAGELWNTHPLTAIACRRVAREMDPLPLPSNLSDQALTVSVRADDRALACLSRREHEVRDRVLAGLSNAEIAEELQLSVRTVEGHVYRLLRKLGLRKRTELPSVSSRD